MGFGGGGFLRCNAGTSQQEGLGGALSRTCARNRLLKWRWHVLSIEVPLFPWLVSVGLQEFSHVGFNQPLLKRLDGKTARFPNHALKAL